MPGTNKVSSNTRKSHENSKNFIKNLTPPRNSFTKNNEYSADEQPSLDQSHRTGIKKLPSVASRAEKSRGRHEEDKSAGVIEEDYKEEDPETSQRKHEKKDFLKKRTKYDPRKAVEEEKKRKK